MRSRYSGYVLKLEKYVLETWHPSTRPLSLGLDKTPRPKWMGLDVIGHEQMDETHAQVEFIAKYKVEGRMHRMHELSRFVFEDGRWYYLGPVEEEGFEV